MKNKLPHGHFKVTDEGLKEVPKKNIKIYGKTIKPDNPLYDAVDTYASVKEYEEITQN